MKDTSKTKGSTTKLEVFLQSKRAGLNGQLISHLVAFIDATQKSLDCAIYDLRQKDVIAALKRVTKKKGLKLRIAFDAGGIRKGGLTADPKPGGTQQALQAAGLMKFAIPIHPTGRHLMHDKFLVRDGRFTWTGSANFTQGGLELQDNNCLSVDSTDFAKLYSQVFADLVSAPSVVAPAISSKPVKVNGAVLTPFFSPSGGEGLEQTVIKALAGAKRVRVLAFLISDPGILAELQRFKSNGNLDIRGVYDPNGMKDVTRATKLDPSLFWFIKDSRFVAAPSHPFKPKGEQDFMHNKVLIVDDHLVVTGSYNFSENAEANDENLVLIESTAVAAAYTHYFDVLFQTYGGKIGPSS